MSSFAGKVAVVTGAGSGIGRALARELARRGARLALSDIDEEGLVETVGLVESEVPVAEVHPYVLDVSDRAAFVAYAEAVVAHFGVVNQVYNNAGVASAKTVLEADWLIYDKVIGTNLWGAIHGSKIFLPHLIASGDGHVINVSSLNGYMAQDELSAYCTTKFGLRGFTETLRIEMLRDRHPVRVTIVHPGGVKTNIANNGIKRASEHGIEVTARERARIQTYNEKLLRMDPGQAANVILDGVQSGKARIRVGNDAKIIDLIVRLFPVGYQRVVLGFNRLARRLN